MRELLDDLIDFSQNDEDIKSYINYLLLQTTQYDNLGKYKILHLDNNDIRFYWYAGKFLSNRKVKKALGMPPWDDDSKNWLLVIDGEECIGISAYEVNLNVKKGYLKSTYIQKDYRGKGIYDYLFRKRLEILKEYDIKLITGTATEMSKPTFVKYGFENVRMRGQYYVFTKEVNNE